MPFSPILHRPLREFVTDLFRKTRCRAVTRSYERRRDAKPHCSLRVVKVRHSQQPVDRPSFDRSVRYRVFRRAVRGVHGPHTARSLATVCPCGISFHDHTRPTFREPVVRSCPAARRLTRRAWPQRSSDNGRHVLISIGTQPTVRKSVFVPTSRFSREQRTPGTPSPNGIDIFTIFFVSRRRYR